MMCLDNETATAYVSGYLEPDEAQQCVTHIAECPGCQRLAEEASELIDKVRSILTEAYSGVQSKDVPPLELVIARAHRPKLFELRADILNLPNSPQFAHTDNSIGNTSSGTTTNALSGRSIQVQARYTF